MAKKPVDSKRTMRLTRMVSAAKLKTVPGGNVLRKAISGAKEASNRPPKGKRDQFVVWTDHTKHKQYTKHTQHGKTM
jgi:hypothetical protein